MATNLKPSSQQYQVKKAANNSTLTLISKRMCFISLSANLLGKVVGYCNIQLQTFNNTHTQIYIHIFNVLDRTGYSGEFQDSKQNWIMNRYRMPSTTGTFMTHKLTIQVAKKGYGSSFSFSHCKLKARYLTRLTEDVLIFIKINQQV